MLIIHVLCNTSLERRETENKRQLLPFKKYCLFQLKELYTLLNENYVEDDDNMFRFDYSPNFLKW